jgi:L-alanine-DL-glutamate epimerase-like enolase superfamily enzyme
MSPEAVSVAMAHAVRNVGRPGIASHAIAAVDSALWDLKARLLGLSLVRLLGQTHSQVPVYGSGGFTSESDLELQEQLGGWADAGMRSVKMKVGRDWRRDGRRVRVARLAPTSACTSTACTSTPMAHTIASRRWRRRTSSRPRT